MGRIVRASVLPAVIAAGSALAHPAPEGWEYDRECCSGMDCAPVPDAAVREVQGGYAVRIEPGAHPMVGPGRQPVERFIAHGDSRIRVSGDSDKHACVVGQHIFCIYVQPGGV